MRTFVRHSGGTDDGVDLVCVSARRRRDDLISFRATTLYFLLLYQK
jgi:hypothetical protein